jgi:hypothetical protein
MIKSLIYFLNNFLALNFLQLSLYKRFDTKRVFIKLMILMGLLSRISLSIEADFLSS